MVMPEEAYKEFGDLYKQEFGERLTQSQTKLKADRVMKLFSKVIFEETIGGKKND